MRRELNELEYLNWCVEQPYNMSAVVRLQGPVDPARLRAALDLAQRRHPLLQVNTVVDERGLPWFDSQGVGPIPLEVVRRTTDAPDPALADRALRSTFAMNGTASPPAPLLRAYLALPPAPGGATDLLLGIQHVIGDGRSMLFLLRDLLRWMADPGAPVEVLDAPASDAELLPPEVRRRVPRTPLKLAVLTPLLRLYLRLRSGHAVGLLATQGHDAPTHAWELTREQTARLRARCKQEGVSVQTALCTAFLSSYSAVNSPVDLRRRLARPVGESVGLYVGSAVVRMAYARDRGFWDNARAFHRKLQVALQDPFMPFRYLSRAVPLARVKEFGSLMVQLMSDERPFAITNLGAFEDQGLDLRGGPFTVESFTGAVTGPVGATVLTVYTVGGVMRLHLRGAAETTTASLAAEAGRALALLLPALEGAAPAPLPAGGTAEKPGATA